MVTAVLTLKSVRTVLEIVPIPGTTKQQRLKENLGAVELELTGEHLRVINEQMAQIQVQGERLPESALKMTGL